MLTHHEPRFTDIDYASLTPEQRAAVVQDAIRRAHAERARVIADMAKSLFRLVAFWRGAHDANAQSMPPNHARHA